MKKLLVILILFSACGKSKKEIATEDLIHAAEEKGWDDKSIFVSNGNGDLISAEEYKKTINSISKK